MKTQADYISTLSKKRKEQLLKVPTADRVDAIRLVAAADMLTYCIRRLTQEGLSTVELRDKADGWLELAQKRQSGAVRKGSSRDEAQYKGIKAALLTVVTMR